MLLKFILIALSLTTATSALASSYYETDFRSFDLFGSSMNILVDNPPSIGPVFSTKIMLNQEPIKSAKLSLTHIGNFDIFTGENWFLSSSTEYIGTLSDSSYLSGYVTDTWIVSESIISKMNELKELDINFWESTGGIDILFIDRMTLTTESTPVPEPATLLLMGVGLLLTTMLRRPAYAKM